MKLLFCKQCQDVFKLRLHEYRTCQCHSSGGRYVDELHAEIWGVAAVPLGFDNSSLTIALRLPPEGNQGQGWRFEAFVIPDGAVSVKRLERSPLAP